MEIALFVNAISSFSSSPVRFIFYIGSFLFVASSAYALYLIIEKLMAPSEVQLGWSSVMVSIWFLGSLIILFLGILGIYTSKIFIEVKRRQRFIARRIYQQRKA